MKNTILIAGGVGFIGRHLCQHFLKAGDKVICIDNLYSSNKSNIEEFQSLQNFLFIQCDIRFYSVLYKFLYEARIERIDKIYNFACPAAPIHYQKDHIYTLQTCFIGTKNLLELAKVYNSSYFQASTSQVYGDPLQHPQSETYYGNVNPIGVRSCYDQGKRVAESLCMNYYLKYKMNIVIGRIFNTYGPYMAQNDGRVVSEFVIRALKDQPLLIYGDGSRTRSFCYISNLISIITQLTNIDAGIGPYNMGNCKQFTINELAKLIMQKIPTSNSSIQFIKELPDDPRVRKPDLSKLIGILGKEIDYVDLSTGLDYTIEYFNKELKK